LKVIIGDPFIRQPALVVVPVPLPVPALADTASTRRLELLWKGISNLGFLFSPERDIFQWPESLPSR